MGNCSLCECENPRLNLQNLFKAELSNTPRVPKIRTGKERQKGFQKEAHELASLVNRVTKIKRPCKVEG